MYTRPHGTSSGSQNGSREVRAATHASGPALATGVSEAEVARRVGVHRQSVNRWAKQLAKGGRPALKRAARAGRPPQLSAAELQRIEQGLKRGPEALGYRTSLWTAWRVADLIERECGVKYSTVHAWRVLRALGWSPQ